MTETQDKTNPEKTEAYPKAGKTRLHDLAEKRAQNLRENLLKRKQQARARTQQDESK